MRFYIMSQDSFSQKKDQHLIFCFSEFGFNNFVPQQIRFPWVFNIFENMFWRTKGVGTTVHQYTSMLVCLYTSIYT